MTKNTFKIAILTLSMIATGGLFIFKIEILGALLALFILLSILFSGIKINRADVFIALFIIVLFVHSVLLLEPNESLTHIWRRFSLFVISFLIYLTNKDSEELFQNLYFVLKVPLYITLMTLFLVLVPGGSLLFTRVDYYYSFLHIFNYVFYEPLVFPRIMGVFFEPGVNQIYLNLLLYISLFQKYNTGFAILTSIAVLSTFSTTGLVVMSLVWIVYIVKNWTSINLRFKISVFLLSLVVAPIIIDNITDKFQGASKGSFEARNVDLIIGLKILYDNPLTGIGFNYEKYYQQGDIHIDKVRTEIMRFKGPYERGSSNSVVRLLFSLGIILSLPFLMGLYYQSIFKEKLLVFIILILCLSSEALLLFPFFLLIAYNGMGLLFRQIARFN